MARSKEFEENAVLDKAMRLFWEQGYEKTSMSDLVEHMGIHRRSIYDTFTDKRTLFLKAMDRFENRTDAKLAAGVKQSQTAREALQFIFDFMSKGEEGAPLGCMFVNSAVELACRDEEVDAKAVVAFEKVEQLLVEVVSWGQRNGEFSDQYEAQELAEYLHNALTGLRVMARTSVPKEKLQRISVLTMEILEK
ncbi:TetR/AcrR family transcriptional regulator [Paenibacillus mucilaginosus]|uniref:TetR family transcriptional regulator n=2 Tax=Paenibacillus mucilaginosus TaxID=61624 RepID=H6NHA4_9BACL|nr:TetR/AcrR family transcriptional regulator [Paenibacillus mucilaginosus]AEI40484.1 transcriptional regulator, TetR family [Paenibacillus mucilaginosus KNP414]AFC29099.1 TetR family transcriptional regulator [Paenibacillus mucilaginosus 3016]MCG7213172.1 TetR/AcrR family transcriptional regulator [Paenibacillus mucilaginosus]WDM29658.1 TetR/AcrR family transcriptional regulator [Paenibacillus mucilaginosus]WFA17841.1 TetR/AcrR family transcriptional regulator [Paenibacillus mucilaginosus]